MIASCCSTAGRAVGGIYKGRTSRRQAQGYHGTVEELEQSASAPKAAHTKVGAMKRCGLGTSGRCLLAA